MTVTWPPSQWRGTRTHSSTDVVSPSNTTRPPDPPRDTLALQRQFISCHRSAAQRGRRERCLLSLLLFWRPTSDRGSYIAEPRNMRTRSRFPSRVAHLFDGEIWDVNVNCVANELSQARAIHLRQLHLRRVIINDNPLWLKNWYVGNVSKFVS